ncbi:MAG: hypothetical protein IJX99_09915 [Clostridia bacterium]|nr:hypothetical protein [Clostridia bacterium]
MNKKIIGLIMVLGIFFGCTSVINAAADAVDGGGGSGGTSIHTCSGGSWYKDGEYHKKKCSTCGEVYESASHSGGSWIKGDTQHYKKCSTCDGYYGYANHSGGSWIKGDTQHYKKCSTCDGYYGYANHSGGSWYSDGDMHYKDCSTCSKSKYTSGSHNNNTKIIITGNTSQHDTECSDCGKDMGKEDHNHDNKIDISTDDLQHETGCTLCGLNNIGKEDHKKWLGGDSPNVHYCEDCTHKMVDTTKQYHFYDVGATLESDQHRLKCELDGCNTRIYLTDAGSFEDLQGLSFYEYTASDATIKMAEVPKLEHGDYTLNWHYDDGNSAIIRDMSGKVILPDLCDEWITLIGWTQRNLKTHVEAAEGYAEEKVAATVNYGWEHNAAKENAENFKREEFILEMLNVASENTYINWIGVMMTDADKTIIDGRTYTPNYTKEGTEYTITYKHPNGGWMFLDNPFFKQERTLSPGSTSTSYTDLFQYGGYDIEEKEEWVANIYYCYRTMDGQVPKNGYANMYTYKTVVVYDAGAKDVTEKISPNMGLIDKTGYRYVGYTKDVGEVGSVKVASAPPEHKGTVAEVTVGWNYTKSAAMVTFFVEPVKLEYGHKWRDMSSNKSPDQIIDAPNLSCISSVNPKALEFPDFYDGEKCVFSVKSLNKFYWPGFMLTKAEVVDMDNQDDMIWEKEYDDSTTTVYTNNKLGDRITIEEKVYSYYVPTETSGYAKDKQFWFIYNTPQIKIEHKYHQDNGGGYVLDINGNPIEGTEQILHQWAKIESLQTDNIGLPHSITIGDKTFLYECPTLDLVQLEIYEVSGTGKETYKGTLYNDEKYKPSSKGKKLSGYTGIFEDYYMDTYSNLKAQFQDNDLFNTNKNWKIVFKYVSVERVYIRFYDLKGNIIFTKDENGRYISQITDLIDKVDGYTHTITDLGEFTPYGYTIEKEAYNKNLDEATLITGTTGNYNPGTIFAPPRDGDRYIIIFYSTEDTLRVNYRDMDNNPLPVPPNYKSEFTTEIPDTGAFVDVPEVPGYKIVEYRVNPNYDGTSNDIPGPGIQIPGTPTEISVPSSGTNQFVIVYYEKIEAPTKLIVEYRKGSPSGDPLKDPVTIPLVTGVETPVSVPTIPGYKPEYHVKNDDPTQNPPYDIVVVGDPETGDQKVIIVYDEGDIPTPDIEEVVPGVITPEDNEQFVELQANTTTENEYDVKSSIPTSEDLYVSGDVYSYKFIEDIEEIAESQTIQVKVVQEYYKSFVEGKVNPTASVSTGPFPVTLDYSYYQVNKAELYDLKSLELENGAIKYYKNYDPTTGTYTEYMEDKAILDVTKEIPTIVYNKPAQVMEITLGLTSLGRLTKEGDTYVITLNDIAYVRPTDLGDKYNENNLSEVLGVFGELTKINLQELKITMPGAEEVVILTGNSYQLNQKTEALKEGVNYLPYAPGRAPLYSFLEDKGLYVKEAAVNQTYQTKMTGVYKMIQAVVSEAIASYDPATVEHARDPIAVNPLSIHTPIINKTELKVSDEHKKTIQLKSEVTTGSAEKLTLEESFTIEILNNGGHKADTGYGTKDYNHNGLLANDTNKLIKDKSDALNNKVITKEMYAAETEEKSIGPAFAEYKLIKFPYDVYLVSGDNGTNKNVAPKDGSTLLKANEWYNLYEYLAPSVTKYTFVIPVWVKDAHKYEGTNGIHVLIVAENCDAATLNAAKANPLSVTATGNSNTNRNDYILRWSKDTYVSGRVYDLQIRDTDDPGFMGKVSPALSGDPSTTTHKEMPIAQKEQVKAYNLGMKLGYRFYFDLKTKGISNKTVNIHPTIYYVSPDGTPDSKVTLFYHSKGSLYNKLTTSDLNIKMTMAGTHGLVNNAGYTLETVAAKQLVPSRVFTNVVTIGKIVEGLSLKRDTEKLPFDNILQAAKAYGFGEDTTKFTTSALTSESIASENDIKNATGHWYGEFYLPASTIVVPGQNVDRQKVISGAVKPLTTGYLVVVFDEITTVEDDPEASYLTYSAPAETQWQKEGVETTLTLPNNEQITIPVLNGAAMAIYQVGLRANNDYETEGTH